MADQEGFLDSIGVGSRDEGALRRKALNEQATRGQSLAAQQARMGQQASPLLHGGVNALSGLITGKGGRSLSGVKKNFGAGMERREEEQDAQASGITLEALRARREIRAATANFKDDGSFESRINMANQVAKIANKYGQLDLVAGALKQVTELQKEREEFTQLGVETRALTQGESLGFEARHINDDTSVKGKAVPIIKGDDAGKFLLVRPGEEDEVVDGSRLVAPGKTSPKGSVQRARKFETLQGIASDQGASGGKIAGLRNNLMSVGENSVIIGNMATNLLNAFDPQGTVGMQGTFAVKADNAIRCAESASTALTGRFDDAKPVSWGGKRVSPEKQYEIATDVGILDRFLAKAGIIDIATTLPPGIEANSEAANLYKANVMQLAYLDARLMEPSNRGLSDKDIEAALERIGAASGNPTNFARRQLEVIDTQLLPRVRNLGNEYTVPEDEFSNPQGYERKDIKNYVYNPEVRGQVEESLIETAELLRAVIDRGPRGLNEAAGAAPTSAAEALAAKKAELARLEGETP